MGANKIESTQRMATPTPSHNKKLTWIRGDLPQTQSRFFLRSTKSLPSASHIYDQSGIRLSMDKLLEGKDGFSKWIPALSNEWGRLAQGNDNNVVSTDCIDFVAKILFQIIKNLHMLPSNVITGL